MKKQVYSLPENNEDFLYGTCKCTDLDKIKIHNKVKKYTTGVKTSRILFGSKTVIIVANIYKDKEIVKKGILGDDFISYKDSKKEAFRIVDELKAHGYKAKYSISVSLKNAARLAGLGVYGKNALIVNPQYGTKLRMAAVITNYVPPEYGKPLVFSPCTDCNKCIEACPHTCLTPYAVDGPKCFCKYLGKKDKFSKEIPMCSICQDICPYNNQTP